MSDPIETLEPLPEPQLPTEPDLQGVLANADELPVVARMVVEIRSDGIRTVARGAFEDFQTGQSVGIETDPLAAAKLAQAFTRSILGSTAGLVRLGVSEGIKSTARSLVPDPLRRLKRKLFGQDPEPSQPEPSQPEPSPEQLQP
ncbi:MAG: hypothetical protein JKY65_09105 [Planctomycetes bacterium]|nr:hypothetical protein [Planctomycetota bacterium]